MSAGSAWVNPFSGLNIPWLLHAQASARGEHPFLIWAPFSEESPVEVYSYARFRDSVVRLATGLTKRGIRHGERVVIHLDNGPEILLSWFALAELGAVAILTNTRSVEAELRHFSESAEAVAAITQPAFSDKVKRACSSVRWIAVSSHDSGDEPTAETRVQFDERFELLFADTAQHTSRSVDCTAPLSVQYTSGTTSRPKGVVWTHANSLWAARECASHTDLRVDDVQLVWNPLFHTNAHAYAMLASLWAGSTIVLRPRVSPHRFWSTAREFACTRTFMSGFVENILREQEKPDAHSFRVWDCASGCVESNLWGIKQVGLYGMTELVSQVLCGNFRLPNHPGTVGRPMPGYRLHLEDETGAACAPGETGNLFVGGQRGVSIFSEYLNDPQATANAFDERGLLRTGDCLQIMEDGSFKFMSRSKDMLKVGGENVAALEIETVVATVQGVAEVAVIGKPHPTLTEVPMAFVRMRPEATFVSHSQVKEQILLACTRELADFKHPREIRIVDDFPRATLGKIAKSELRSMLSQIDKPF